MSSLLRSRSGISTSPPCALLPGAPVQALERGQLERGDAADAVGGAVDPPVVDADQVPVGGQPDVALEGVGALVDRAQVGLERVLRLVPAGSSVGDDLRDPRRRGHDG